MNFSTPPHSPGLEEKTFLLFLAAVSLAFALILWPFFGAVLWGVVLAVMFAPLHGRMMKRMRQRRTLAAISTLIIIVVMVILPLTLLIASLVEEAAGVYRKIESGELNFGAYFKQVTAALPAWVVNLQEHFGLTNLGVIQERLSAGLTEGSKFLVTHAINIGTNTFNFFLSLFVMLYLLFFLIRDGEAIAARIRQAIPLPAEQQQALIGKFTTVIRATVKGNLVVAVLQGGLGGLIFWVLGIHAALLWAVLMTFLSLLPALGAAMVWFPVAIYLLATGSVWRGVVLLAYGVLVISLVDNFVRPILVGKDTKIPDYVVLISTLGGIAIFGVNGFVIGPVIAAMFIAFWDIFSTTRRKTK